MPLLAVLLLTISLALESNSLQCYHCNATFPPPDNPNEPPRCALPSVNDADSNFGKLITCDEPESSGDDDLILSIHDSYPACMISTSVIGQSEFHMRSCVEIDPSMDGKCVDHVEEDGSERHLCYCAEDGCNATPDTVKVPVKVPKKPTKCYECIPGDSTESAELPDCMINSTEPGNLITCNENSVGCEITTIELKSLQLSIRKCSSKEEVEELCVMTSPEEMPETRGEKCFCKGEGCNATPESAKLHSLASNINMPSFFITIFLMICIKYFM